MGDRSITWCRKCALNAAEHKLCNMSKASVDGSQKKKPVETSAVQNRKTGGRVCANDADRAVTANGAEEHVQLQRKKTRTLLVVRHDKDPPYMCKQKANTSSIGGTKKKMNWLKWEQTWTKRTGKNGRRASSTWSVRK